MKYAQIIHTILERPWAIQRETLKTIVHLAAYRAAGQVLSEEEISERLAAAPQRSRRESAGLIAILPIHGIIVPRATLFTEMSGATSVEGLSRGFREAMASPDVGAIVFDVDSPGGMVDGIPEFAAEIRAARGQKPMVAVSNYTSASAAYWLACQADEVVAAPSSITGSIGVYSAHEDWSAFWDGEGIKTTLISAGKFKVEGNEFEPLSDDAREFLQSIVNDYYGLFINDVAKGRNVPASQVRSGFGQGRALTAKRAQADGLIDRIDTLDGVIGRLARQVVTRRDTTALGPSWETMAAMGTPTRADIEKRIAEALALEGSPETPDIVEVEDDPPALPGEASPDEPEVTDVDPETPAKPSGPTGAAEVELAKARARSAARSR